MPYGVVGGPYGQGAPVPVGGPAPVAPAREEGDMPPLGNMDPPAAAAAAAAAADMLLIDVALAEGAKQLTAG